MAPTLTPRRALQPAARQAPGQAAADREGRGQKGAAEDRGEIREQLLETAEQRIRRYSSEEYAHPLETEELWRRRVAGEMPPQQEEALYDKGGVGWRGSPRGVEMPSRAGERAAGGDGMRDAAHEKGEGGVTDPDTGGTDVGPLTCDARRADELLRQLRVGNVARTEARGANADVTQQAPGRPAVADDEAAARNRPNMERAEAEAEHELGKNETGQPPEEKKKRGKRGGGSGRSHDERSKAQRRSAN